MNNQPPFKSKEDVKTAEDVLTLTQYFFNSLSNVNKTKEHIINVVANTYKSYPDLQAKMANHLKFRKGCNTTIAANKTIDYMLNNNLILIE